MPTPPDAVTGAASAPTTQPVAPGLGARIVAEALGTAFLLTAIVGSGFAAQHLAPDDAGLVLAVNALTTGAILTVLIVTLQPISAAFNPIVTLLDRCHRQLSTPETLVLIAAQLAGGLIGVVVANVMFDASAITISGHHRAGAGTLIGEAVAALGLLLVIAVITRTGRSGKLALAVGAYIAAAIWFTSSTSFANPAVTLARILTDSYTGIAPGSALAFVAVQVAVVAPAYLLVRQLVPHPSLRSTSRRSVSRGP